MGHEPAVILLTVAAAMLGVVGTAIADSAPPAHPAYTSADFEDYRPDAKAVTYTPSSVPVGSTATVLTPTPGTPAPRAPGLDASASTSDRRGLSDSGVAQLADAATRCDVRRRSVLSVWSAVRSAVAMPARVVTPNLARMLAMWCSTVRGLR